MNDLIKRPSVNGPRLIERLNEQGNVGRDDAGRLSRLVASDADKAGRDWFVSLAKSLGLDVKIDRIGNIFAVWSTPQNFSEAPVLLGSHVDSVIDAGIFDGPLGVLAGIEVVQTLMEAGIAPKRPIAVAAFTNEEGVRYQPTMIGSLAYVGGVPFADALAIVGVDGTVLGEELSRIGYMGDTEKALPLPHAYLEIHIEQGPILESAGIPIGAVDGVQGILQQEITIEGSANHAGTTPMQLRRDAGHAAARIVTFMHDRARNSNTGTVTTTGCMRLEPHAINIIPSRAVFTVDVRDRNPERLAEEERALEAFLKVIEREERVTVSVSTVTRSQPTPFDEALIRLVEEKAKSRGLESLRLTSGAGHDAKMLAKAVPSTMIFVPSVEGISHNPKEYTHDAHVEQGANVLLDATLSLVS